MQKHLLAIAVGALVATNLFAASVTVQSPDVVLLESDLYSATGFESMQMRFAAAANGLVVVHPISSARMKTKLGGSPFRVVPARISLPVSAALIEKENKPCNGRVYVGRCFALC